MPALSPYSTNVFAASGLFLQALVLFRRLLAPDRQIPQFLGGPESAPPKTVGDNIVDSSGDLCKWVGVESNRSAIGARVTARYGGRVQVQELLSQASFHSASDFRLHFGLRQAEAADLEIRWPNRNKENVVQVAANHLVVIREGGGVVRKERFPNA